ncbi:BspA family leucine-rich repeat surface protein [Christiangramia aestuarii]|uniref:BspA family leucine-rich repeat surface protein n=2 Tax=Christiangramia aestuarii TaxID=1028746 RepID=UPI0031EB7BD4
MDRAFWGCKNLVISANDIPDLSNATKMNFALAEIESINAIIGNWDVSNVKEMVGLFYNSSFNHNINNWDVSNVINMTAMFRYATSFNQPLDQWNVGNVETMSQMFDNATAFNQEIGNWDVRKVTSMWRMFLGATNFNQDIGNWDVSNVTNMGNVFENANSFNQDISQWNVGQVTNMYFMFKNAPLFNQNIGKWDVSKVTNMYSMFHSATSFNQDIGNWDVSQVTSMGSMFYQASSFNQDLGNWDISQVTGMPFMFYDVTLSTENYDNLLIGWSSQNLQTNVNFHGGNSQHCAGATARQQMIDDFGWTITDAGPAGDLLTLDQEILPDINESCEVFSIPSPTATDCSGQIITASTTTEFPITTQGETIVTWFFDDGIGNTVEQQQTVIIADLAPPTITCEPIIVETDEGQCEANIVVPSPAVSDNCNLSSTALDFDGLNDYVEIQNFPFLQDFTIEAWVNPVYIPNEGYRSIVSKGAVFDANTNFDFGIRRNFRNGNYFVYLYFQGGATINGIALEIDNTSNTWTHLAGSFDGTTKTLKLYQDGKLLGSNVSTTTPTDGGHNLRIGHPATIDGQDEPYTGKIDEVRIWNYALTDEEVLSTHNKVLAGSEPGLQAYYNFEDGPGSNTLTDQSNNQKNGSLVNMDPSTDWIPSGAEISTISLTNNITNTAEASGIYPVGDTEIIWTAIDANGNESTCTQTITVEDNESPLTHVQDVYLKLDENGQATLTADQVNDNSTDNCGIQTISIDKNSFTCDDISSNGETTYSVKFNGSSDYIQIGNNSNLNVSSEITLQAWAFPTADQNGIIINKEGEYEMARFPDGQLKYALGETNAIWQWVDTGVFLPLNEWSHVTLTYDGAVVNIYKNGSLQSSINRTGPIGDSETFQNDLRIGGRQGFSQYFHGNLTGVSVWNIALDNSMITNNYNQQLEGSEAGLIGYWPMNEGSGGQVIDNSPNNNNGTLMNQATWSQNSPISGNSANQVRLSVTDIHGNTSTTIANVIVEDKLPPTVVTQDIDVYLDANGQASITTADIDNNSTDNCGIASYSLDIDSFDCNDIASNAVVVTLTVTDVNGNSGSATANVTVHDNVAPTVLTQDIDVYLDANGQATITPAEIDNNSSDNCRIQSYALDIDSFDCNDIAPYPVVVTLTVTDVNGNSDAATANVTVYDKVPPTVLTQDIDVYLDANGQATITPAEIDNNSSDNCGIASYSLDIDFFGCNDIASNPVVVTLTVTDVNGNSDFATANVTVHDNVAPTVLTQDIDVYLDSNGQASITPANINNNSSDNCGIQNYALDIDSFDCNDIASNPVVVTLTATDVNGNSDSATANVTVHDNVAPTVLTQDIDVYLDANGQASITPADIDNNSSDNCGIQSYALDIDSFSCTDIGSNPVVVTLTITDVNGNSDTATANITVHDNVAPIVLTQDIDVYLEANGRATIIPGEIDNNSSDNCGIQSYVLDIDSFDCNDIASNPVVVTLTVTDVNGNSDSATANVTVHDNVAPTVLTQDIDVYLDSNGQATITPAEIDNNSSDNCGIADYALDIDAFDCIDIASNPVVVTLTVTDVNGNSDFATANVTVHDNVAPIVLTQDIDAYLDANGQASITPAEIDNNSSDNCGIQSYLLDIDSFDCNDIASNPVVVTLTVTDFNGNSDFATANVTVHDNVAPTVLTQDIDVYLDANGQASITPADIDNNSSDNCGIASYSLDIDSFGCNDIATNPVVVTLSVTDVNGNSDAATANVTVHDNVAPTVLTQDIDVYLDANGQATITPAEIDNNSSDNCGIQSYALDIDSFDCNDIAPYPIVVTLTVTDVNGNSDAATANVTVYDKVPPTVLTQDIDVYLDANGQATITPAEIDNNSSDNCGITSYSLDIDSFGCNDIASNPVVVTLTVTDVNGNSDSATANVTVHDDVAPDIACISVQEHYVDPYQNYYTVQGTEFDATATDACGIGSLTYSGGITNTAGTSMDGVQLELGVNTMTWTAIDVNTNSSDCTTSVTIKKRPTTLTYNGDAQEQYSDNVSLSATLLDDVSGIGIIGKIIKFTIGSQSTTAVTDANGLASANLKLTQDPANTYTVEADFLEDASYLGSTESDAFDITQENAMVAYTGQSLQATPTARDTEAWVVLSANIQDITANSTYTLYDAFEGDIRNAKIKFSVDETSFDSGWLPVTDLIDPSDSKTARVSYDWLAQISGNNTSESFTVRILVDNGYYLAEDETVVTVYIPTGDFITGGGHILPDASAGEYASTPGLKTNFGFNVKYNKKGTKLKGHMNVIFRRLESDGSVRKYQIKSNAVQSLGVDVSDPDAQVATFITKSNLTDITDPLNPVSLGGNLILKVDMTDRGEPGTDDSISFTLTDGNTGELLYSSNWTGIASEEMDLSGGNLVVHSGFSLADESGNTELNSTSTMRLDQETSLDFSVAPNPSENYFTVKVITENVKNRVYLMVFSYSGSLIYETSGKPTDDFTFGDRFEAATYIVKISQGIQTAEKVIIKK